MRRTRTCGTMVGLSAGTAAALGAILLAAPGAGAHSSGDGGGSGRDLREIRMDDDCEPASFDEAVGPGTCVGDGDTTFQDAVAQVRANGLVPNRSVEDWDFEPGEVQLDHGDRLRAVNRGGEVHTFTEVPHFGPGCNPVVNELLGLGRTAVPVVGPEHCEERVAATAVAPGGTRTVDADELAPGEHLFECLFHPWMQSVVMVDSDDEHDAHDPSG